MQSLSLLRNSFQLSLRVEIILKTFMRDRNRLLIFSVALLFLCASASRTASAQTTSESAQEQSASSKQSSAEIARKLSSRDALERQRAAEELARLVATDQTKIVAGYRAEEKNERVRLALDWALYRMGKAAALFAIVRDLDSSRRNQSYAYLIQLESPEPLYAFLPRTNAKTQIALLEVLARIGDDETVARVQSFTASTDEKVAEAARFATSEITRRQSQTTTPTTPPARPRQTGRETEDLP